MNNTTFRWIIAIVVTTLFATSCNKAYSGLRVDLASSINKTDYIDSLHFKSLDITPIGDDFPLKNPRIFDVKDDLIFLTSNKNIVILDKNSGLMTSFSRHGRGPEEYLSLFGCCTDKDEQVIYVAGISDSRLMSYDYDGNFIAKHIFDSKVTDVRCDSDGNLWLCLKGGPYSIAKLDQYYNIAANYAPEKNIEEQRGMVVFNGINKFNGDIYFNPVNCDTIYNLSSKEYLLVNQGHFKMPDELYMAVGNEEMQDKYIFIQSYCVSNDFFFTEYLYQRKYYCDVWNAKNHTLIFRNVITSETDIPYIHVPIGNGVLPFWPTFIANGKLYAVVDGYTAHTLFPEQYSDNSNGFIVEIEI
ncbi:MAG: 6-bladed beta-propeller [Bacteroidales bacterium]|nr:6-bladed beta-propeller [Bacteroidales bacterium]MDD4669551.1 6-bladed beta-propeller [Bacteroidales bacterium]